MSVIKPMVLNLLAMIVGGGGNGPPMIPMLGELMRVAVTGDNVTKDPLAIHGQPDDADRGRGELGGGTEELIGSDVDIMMPFL